MESTDQEILVEGLKQIWELEFGYTVFMALKCVVELRIPDIIDSYSTPVSLSQIASGIDSSYVDLPYLARITRVLVHKKLFTTTKSPETGETLYELPRSSRWLLKDSKLTLCPILRFSSHQWLLAPWHYFSECVKDGGIPFKKAHNGQEMWELLGKNPEFNNIFNEGLASVAKLFTRPIIDGYEQGFEQIKSMVDVGGGKGGYLVDIVKAYPHINGIIFDLPHVISTLPTIDGITLVGGDMFESIPSADAIFIKNVLHDWTDQDCVKILRNCRKALDEKTGRVIIVDIVLQEVGNMDVALTQDLMMLAHTTGGKERTDLEFKMILEEAGFPRYNIIKLGKYSIIEAFPQ